MDQVLSHKRTAHVNNHSNKTQNILGYITYLVHKHTHTQMHTRTFTVLKYIAGPHKEQRGL